MLAVVVIDIVVLVLRGDVGVSGHRDHRPAHHLVVVKELFHKRLDDLFCKDIPQPPFAQTQIGRQALGNGDQAETALSAPLELYCNVKGFAGQVGKRVEGVHYLGREDREHIVPEIAFTLLVLLHIQLWEGEGADITSSQPGLQLLKEFVPLLVEGAHCLEDSGQLLGRGETALGVDMGLFHQGHVVYGAHPNHEKLV